jgi:prolyl-tRNA editing enzyme YbaK/EbsC (Cys-tRNA(Pro) deacylase)
MAAPVTEGYTMAEELSRSTKKIREALSALGAAFEVRELPDSTRTAVDAAGAIGCSVEQIAKSIVFRTAAGKDPVMVIASGVHRINEKKVADAIGEAIEKADADFVREKTGFSIGGVPPIGHASPIPVLIDEDLLTHGDIWAAAGTPHSVFRISADGLVKITNGKVISVV